MKIDKLVTILSADNLDHVEVRITSYVFVGAMNAEHYYGNLIFYGVNYEQLGNHEMRHKITKEEIEYLDRKEQSGGRLKREYDDKGFVETGKYNSEKDIITEAYDICSKIADKIKHGFNLWIEI